MRRNSLILQALAFCFVLVLGITGCTKEEEEVEIPTVKEFAGSETCKTCHSEIYAKFIESGHPYKITKINGKKPEIPYLGNFTEPMTPDGYTWNDISYTIGGYGWKMRFIDKKGFSITGNVVGTQWNPQDNSRSQYNSTVPTGTEKYTCGACHTTGWKSIKDGGTAQDGLAGMDGSFFKGGVHCEQCHGMGNVHTVTKNKSDVTVNKTTALCAQCHQRRWDKGDFKQQTSGGWEMHRNQVEQLKTNKHNATMSCNSCHDVHSSTKHDAKAKGNGITKTCITCHTNTAKYSTSMHQGATCVQCHMPKTVKNGIAFNKYMGDAPNHNFKINTSATATYLTTDATGTWANLDGSGSTLDFVCYQCHVDQNGEGGKKASAKTRVELSNKAKTFHK